MSVPQHCGDLIFPSQDGHCEIWTSDPSSSERKPFSNGISHLPQFALTDIPHLLHSYVVILLIFIKYNNLLVSQKVVNC